MKFLNHRYKLFHFLKGFNDGKTKTYGIIERIRA